jgi:hypothetical protein
MSEGLPDDLQQARMKPPSRPRNPKTGRFIKKAPPLDPALVRRLGAITVDCQTYDNVLERLRPPRPPVRAEEGR